MAAVPVTAEIARRAAVLAWNDLPADLVERTKQCLLDWFAVTVPGAQEELTDILVREALEDGAKGQASLVRPLRVYHAVKACRGTASQKEDWVFVGVVDEQTNQMTLQVAFATSEETGESICTLPGYVDRMELDPSLFGDLERIVIPLDSGATKQETLREPNGTAQEWLTVKVLGVPGK